MADLIFSDRRHAGQQLAAIVRRRTRKLRDPLVLAIPSGGVPVAVAIADLLDAPLDVLVVRKILAPDAPGRTLGALATDGSKAFNRELVPDLGGISDADLSDAIRIVRADVYRKVRDYRSDRPFPDVVDRDVILVSDGMNTGVAMLAAARRMRRLRPRHLYVAVPAASRLALRRLQDIADDVICLDHADAFLGVGCYYVDFSPTSDDDVRHLLDRGRPTSGTADEPGDSLRLH